MGGLVAHGSNQYVNPLIPGEQFSAVYVLLEIDLGNLDRRQPVQCERTNGPSFVQRIIVAVQLLVTLEHAQLQRISSEILRVPRTSRPGC